jgi:hypothetical protein
MPAPELLDSMAALWRQERAAARAQFEAARQSTTLARRVTRGLAVDDLIVAEEQAAPRDRVRALLIVPDRIDLDALRIGPGDPVLVGDGQPQTPASCPRSWCSAGWCSRQRCRR